MRPDFTTLNARSPWRVITMAASNRNYTFKQPQSFTECFVWLNNSQSDLRRK